MRLGEGAVSPGGDAISPGWTQSHLGATRPEAADKIAVYRVKVFLFELF